MADYGKVALNKVGDLFKIGTKPRSLADSFSETTVNAGDFGVIANDGKDHSDELQNAIDYVYNAGGGYVDLPKGTVLITKNAGTAPLPTSDDGTVQTGYGTALSPEPVNDLPYSIKMRPGVILRGKGVNSTILKGDYIYGNADLNQKMMFSFVDNTGGSATYYHGLEKLQIQNSFMAYVGLDTTFALANFDKLKFSSCAIGIYANVLERCRFNEIEGQSSGSILVVGGQWRTRNDNYYEKGGFADKCYFNKITFNYGRVLGVYEQNIDTFFDTYFFKTVNNTSRLSTPIQASSIAKILKYKGICGHAITILPRYWRNSVNNDFNNIFHAYSPRAVVYGGNLRVNRFNNINIESCGYRDNINHTSIIGVDYQDPYMNSTDKVQTFIAGTDDTCEASCVQLQNSRGKQALDDNIKYSGLDVYGNSTMDISQSKSRTKNMRLESTTANALVLTGATDVQNDIKTNGNFIGDVLTASATATAGSTVTSTFTLTNNKTYLATLQAKFGGTLANSANKTCIIQNYTNSGYSIVGVDDIGTVKRSNTGNAPSNLTISTPDSSGVITVSATSASAGTIQFVLRLIPMAY